MSHRSLVTFAAIAAATILAGCGTEPTSAPQIGTLPRGPSANLQTQSIDLQRLSTPSEIGTLARLIATASSGLPITFETTTPGVCELDTDSLGRPIVRYLAVGLCIVFAIQAGNDVYADARAARDVDVKGMSQFISLATTPPNPAQVNGTYVIRAEGSTSDIPTIFSSLTLAICTVGESIFDEDGESSSTVTFNAEGLCIVAADRAGNDRFQAAAQKTQQIMVGKLAQSIAFTSTPPSQPVVGGTYTVSATGGTSGNPVTFTSLTPNVCRVNGNTVSYDTGGECTVAADQAGNDNYKPGVQATQAMMVGKAAQSIQFTSAPPEPAFATETYAVAATGGASNNTVAFSSLTAGVCTVSGTTVTLVGSGLCTVAADQPGNDSYLAAPQEKQDFTVFKRNQKVLFVGDFFDALVNDTYTPVATATSGLVPVTFSVRPAAVCTISGGVVKFVGVGICTISGTQAGDAAFNPITVSFDVTVTYGFQGFASPVNKDGALNVAKAGQAIPLKWRLVDGAGVPMTTLTSATITVKELVCGAAGSTIDQVEEYASGGSGLQNLGDGYYQMNWKSPTSYKGSCKTLMLTLGSGGSYSAAFQFTK